MRFTHYVTGFDAARWGAAMKAILLLICLLLVPALCGPNAARAGQETQPQSLKYEEIQMPPCNMTLLVGGSVVFTTKEELRARFHRHTPPCNEAQIPRIDFDKYTLIGRWITLGNCPAGKMFTLKVIRDDKAQVYRHVVNVETMPCRGLSSYMSWVLVPKLPEGYTVNFEGSAR
jgi:hypothetical protein